MSAQRSSQQSTSTSSRSEQGRESTALAQRSALPSLPSLLLDPFGFFSDDDPFTLLRGIQREMSRAFGQGVQGRRAGNGLTTTIWVPPIEVQYKDGNFVVSAELPGLRDEDVSVAITDDSIVISGERQEQHEETQGGMRRSELRYGQFYRAIPLPDGADPEKAQAEFKNGVLQITVPVSEARSNVRQIPVQSATSSQSASGQAGSQTAGQSTQQKPTGSESGQKAA
jgi:HSP20 family protein